MKKLSTILCLLLGASAVPVMSQQQLSDHLDRYADGVFTTNEEVADLVSPLLVGVNPPSDLQDDEYIIGNCPDSPTSWSVPMGKPTSKAAIACPAELAEFYKGDKLTKIRFYYYTGYGRGVAQPKAFIYLADSYGDPADTPYLEIELDADELLDGWNEVELEEPFVITGEKFFIGWSAIPDDGVYPFATARESFSSENAPDDCWFYEGTWSNSTTYGKMLIRGVVKDEQTAGCDMILVSMQPKLYIGDENSYELHYKYALGGDKEVSKYYVRYSIDGGPEDEIFVDMTQNEDENNRVIRPGGIGQNTVSIPNNIALSEGKHTFRMELVPDGLTDTDEANNVKERFFYYNPEYQEELVRYSTDLNNKNSVGMSSPDGKSKILRGAIMIPSSRMKEYLEGEGEISMIRFYTQKNNDRWIKDARVFITKDLFGEPLYEQSVDSVMETGWNEVYLDTPFKVTDSDSIFIGWRCLSQWGGSPIVYDQTGPLKYGAFFGVGEEDESYQEWGENVGNGALYLEAMMYTKNVPEYNVQLMNFYAQPYSKVGEKMNISTYIVNEGPEVINDMKLICQVGENDPVEILLEGLDITSGRYISTSLKVPVVSSNNAVEKVTLSAVLDGDYDESDNNVEGQTRIYETSVPRKVLIEEFTSQDCTSCLTAVYELNNAIKGSEDDAVIVSHHSGSFADDLSVETSYNLLWFFNVLGSSYNPAIMTDRFYISGVAELAPVYASGLLTASLFNELLLNPCFITLDISGHYNVDERKLNVKVSGEQVEELLGENIVLNVWLVEDGIEGYQKTNGSTLEDYIHNNVMRFSLTNEDEGLPIDLSDGTFSEEFEFVIPETLTAIDANYNETDRVTAVIPDNMRVVAFVSNYDKTNAMNCEVYNSEQVALHELNSVETAKEDASVNIFVSADKVIFSGDYEVAELYSVSGMLCGMTEISNSYIDVAGLPEGVYAVKVKTENSVIVKKIVIRR